MPRNEDHQPPLNDTNNLTGVRVTTWEDERRNATSFELLSPESREKFLSMIGHLCGVRVDCNDGPKRAPCRVAVLKSGRQVYFREMTELATENVTTQNEREANYVHQGWSLSAFSTTSPWIRLRIASNNQSNRLEESITKRMITYRLRCDVLPGDLTPVPEFDAAVRNALGIANRTDIFQALYEVFDRWGDVVPISFDVGISLTVTDLRSNATVRDIPDKTWYHSTLRLTFIYQHFRRFDTGKAPISPSEIESFGIANHRTAKVLTQGADLSMLQMGVKAWIQNSEVPIGRWSQVKVTKTVPITALLSTGLQERLMQLHNSLLTYYPLALEGDADNACAFDDTLHALKTIRSVTIHCTKHVKSLCVTYLDGSASTRRGANAGPGSTFHLGAGEHIFEMHIWRDSNGVSSIQFFTTTGRASQAYGGGAGMPAILTGNGGILTAFAGKVKNDSIFQLQGIWRHDIQSTGPNTKRKYSQYHGEDWGHRFNDLPLLKRPDITISKIKIHCGDGVDAIQASVTYTYQEGGRATTIEGPHRGGPGGGEHVFDLKAGEYITTVKGGICGNLVHLCFVTNQGRTSPIYGKPEGDKFVCQAPLTEDGKAMRLYSVCGRCGGRVDGLLCVWAAV